MLIECNLLNGTDAAMQIQNSLKYEHFYSQN